MGLDTSHDCWHGGYGRFTQWRRDLAKAAGLPPLDLMEGFWSSPRGPDPFGAALTIKVAALSLARAEERVSGRTPNASDLSASLLRTFDFDPIRWDALKPDVLHALLHHSDCDGSIPAAECGPLADRLEELLPLLPTSYETGPHDGLHGPASVTQLAHPAPAQTRRFIDGLRKAAAAGEDVEFH